MEIRRSSCDMGFSILFQPLPWLCFVGLMTWCSPALYAQDKTYRSQDTLSIAEDLQPDAHACLTDLAWQPRDFEVRVRSLESDQAIELRFPSPRPCGVAQVDEVTAEWHVARDEESGDILWRPAVIVVHESGSKMHVGRLVARELARRGVHAFMVQLPGYGNRKSDEYRQDDLVAVFKQGIADVRRARDAVAVLPEVDSRHIGLQGTSLGGFVATLAGSLDAKFDSNFLLLCGGNLHGVLTSGAKDAEKALQRLQATGVSGAELKSKLHAVEPLRIAHRLPPERTWLYSATFDQVVLPKYSVLLAEVAGLPAEHHIKMLATHYSGVVFLPGVLEKITETALEHTDLEDAELIPGE